MTAAAGPKALVLAAGRGSRMRATAAGASLGADQAAAADAGQKAMMPLGGRPFLDHALNALADAGFTDIGIVFSPAHHEARAYYRALPLSRTRITLLEQPEPRGTADAVLAGEAWTAGGAFLVLNGDNLYPVDVLARLRETTVPSVPGFRPGALALPPDRIGAFALIDADARGCLSRIVEKPGAAGVDEAGPDALVSMNLWRFDARIFDACRDVPISERGEKELPQAVGLAAARGVCIKVIPVWGEVLDLSSRGDVARVARRLDDASVAL